MAWIESHQTLRNHPKKDALSEALFGGSVPDDVADYAAVGLLQHLWWWALDYAQDGDLSSFTDRQVAKACRWSGDPATLRDALQSSGFMTGERQLHDWYDYAGKLIERRAKDADRGRSMREAYADGTINAVRDRDGNNCRYCDQEVNWQDRRGPAGGTYDHVDPTGPTTPENLVVCCRSCNSKKGNRSLAKCGLVLTQVGTSSSPRSDSLPKELKSSKGSKSFNGSSATRLAELAKPILNWKVRDDDDEFFAGQLEHFVESHIADVMRRFTAHQTAAPAASRYKDGRRALANWLKRETPDPQPLDEQALSRRQRFCLQAIRGEGFDAGLTDDMTELHDLKEMVLRGLTEQEVLSWR